MMGSKCDANRGELERRREGAGCGWGFTRCPFERTPLPTNTKYKTGGEGYLFCFAAACFPFPDEFRVASADSVLSPPCRVYHSSTGVRWSEVSGRKGGGTSHVVPVGEFIT